MVAKLVALVLPLGLDAFAVAAALGMTDVSAGRRLRLALLFTAFEAGMPLIGLALGAPLGHVIGGAADYVAIGVLLAFGLYTLLSSEDGEEEKLSELGQMRGLGAIVLGISVSLDELAIGFTLGLLRLPTVLVITVHRPPGFRCRPARTAPWRPAQRATAGGSRASRGRRAERARCGAARREAPRVTLGPGSAEAVRVLTGELFHVADERVADEPGEGVEDASPDGRIEIAQVTASTGRDLDVPAGRLTGGQSTSVRAGQSELAASVRGELVFHGKALTMTKQELAQKVASGTGLTGSAATGAVDATFEAITAELAGGGDVAVAGFGKFSVSERSAREGRNPATGATIQIAASTAAKFSPATALKKALNSLEPLRCQI